MQGFKLHLTFAYLITEHITGCVSASGFALLVAIPIGTVRSAVGLKIRAVMFEKSISQ